MSASPYRPVPDEKARTYCVYCGEVLNPRKRIVVRKLEGGGTLWCCSGPQCLARYHRERDAGGDD